MKFNELNINKEVLRVIDELGFENPTKIQEEIIPLILDNFDVVGQAQTGTGKTLAFAAAILSKLDFSNKDVKALVLAPTRELAIQVKEEIAMLAKYTNAKVISVYGSSSIDEQIRNLKQKCDIVVGTPGRVMDLLNRKVLKLNNLQFFVLDEADEMLNMGFRDDIESIFQQTKEEKQVLLFSATMPKMILTLAEKYMNETYEEVSVVEDIKTAKNVEQKYYLVGEKHRVEAMCRVMDKYNPKRAMIFCKTKRNVDELYAELSNRHYNVDIIHGDITQKQRILTLDRFKKGAFKYLIATDVAARGIHVDDIEVVINYNLPQDNEAYVHRIGRTGRADKHGLAITFINPREERIMLAIERHINTKIIKDNVPTLEDIIPMRYNELLEELSNKAFNKDNNVFKDYLDSITSFEVRNICAFLLNKELLNNIGSNFKVDITSKEASKSSMNNMGRENDGRIRSRNKDKGGTRVFLTIGKMDNIDKKGLFTFLETTANLPKGVLSNVEIMPKFTFLNVEPKYLDVFMKKCHNTKYNDRVIRIEKANR